MNTVPSQDNYGLRLVCSEDQVRIIEPNGATSVTINLAMKQDDKPFRICHLLIAHKIIEDRKAAAGK